MGPKRPGASLPPSAARPGRCPHPIRLLRLGLRPTAPESAGSCWARSPRNTWSWARQLGLRRRLRPSAAALAFLCDFSCPARRLPDCLGAPRDPRQASVPRPSLMALSRPLPGGERRATMAGVLSFTPGARSGDASSEMMKKLAQVRSAMRTSRAPRTPAARGRVPDSPAPRLLRAGRRCRRCQGPAPPAPARPAGPQDGRPGARARRREQRQRLGGAPRGQRRRARRRDSGPRQAPPAPRAQGRPGAVHCAVRQGREGRGQAGGAAVEEGVADQYREPPPRVPQGQARHAAVSSRHAASWNTQPLAVLRRPSEFRGPPVPAETRRRT